MKHKIHILALAAAVAVSAQSAFAENLVIATNNGDMVRMQNLTDDFSAKHPDIELETAEEQYANDITEVALGDELTAGEPTPSPLFQSIAKFPLSPPENYSWENCRRTLENDCLCDVSGYKNVLFGGDLCDKDSYFLRERYFSFKEDQNEYLQRIKAYLVTLEDVLKTAQIAEANLLDFYKTPVTDINCNETKEYLNKKLGDLNNAILHFGQESSKAFYAAEVKFVTCLNSLELLNSVIVRDMITYEPFVREVEKKEGVSVDTTSLLLHFNKDDNPYPNRQRCPVRDIIFSKEQISNVRGEIEARHNNIKEKHNEWVEGNSCGWTKDMTSLGKLQ